MAKALAVAVGTMYSVNIPAGVTLVMRLPTGSVNHRLPPRPPVIPPESRPPGTGISVILPAGDAEPTPCCFVNQTLPSGPAAMPTGPTLTTAVPYRANVPAVDIFEMALGSWLLNQRFPSGPVTMAPGWLF